MPIGDVARGELFAEQPHANPGDKGEADQARERREAEQNRARRAGEADMRQRMAGERLPAQNEEEADYAGEHRRHPRGDEGGAHEIVVKHGCGHGRLAMRVALDVDIARHDVDSDSLTRTTSIGVP